MARLPNVDRAVVDPRKITRYLLDPTHVQGGAGKSGFFMSFGFRRDRWELLRDALTHQARLHDLVAGPRATPHGEIYEIVGPLESPDGRNPFVLVAWMIRRGEDFPRFVTAIPARRPLP